MKYLEILSLEYKEQYNQYRWIGTMQSVILTFYGVVASASLLIASKFVGTNSAQSDFLWPSRIAVFLGLLGITVAIGLIKSRGMQARTAKYLAAILNEMAHLSKDPVLPPNTALRYRGLCTSKGQFAFLDTGNIAVYLSFVFGQLLTIVGLFVSISIEVRNEIDFEPHWLWLLLVLAVILVLPKWLLSIMRKAEQCALDDDFYKLKDSIGLVEGMRKFGITGSEDAGS